jgi:hypothetical protein
MKPFASRTVTVVGFRPIEGAAMYKSLVHTDLLLALTLAFAALLIVVRIIARAIRWIATAHDNKPNAFRSPAESI